MKVSEEGANDSAESDDVKSSVVDTSGAAEIVMGTLMDELERNGSTGKPMAKLPTAQTINASRKQTAYSN